MAGSQTRVLTPAQPKASADGVGVLLGDEFAASTWGRRHRIWRAVADPDDFLTVADIQRALDASLLRWPYFVLVRDGAQVPAAACTTTRDVIGQRKGGFPDEKRIRAYMRDGATLKLNNLGDWHRPTARLESSLGRMFSCVPTSYVFWTPAGERGMRPHRDAAHVVVIQLSGRKRWHIYAEPDQVNGSAGLDVDVDRPTDAFELTPGDVLYLPHGWPHAADALAEGSIHLTITLAPATPEDLVEGVLGEFIRRHGDLVHRHHALALPAKSAAVRDALRSVVTELDSPTWREAALAAKRSRR